MADAQHILDNGGQPQFSAAAPEASVPVKKVIVVIATGWGPLYGGINSFSFDFSLALGRMFRSSVRVICLTTNVDDLTRRQAKADHVEIYTLPKVGPGDEHKVASNARELLDHEGITNLDLAFGHDVVTGPAAIELCALLGGKAALFHHMSYIQYQGAKKNGRSAIEMDADQKTILCKADYVIAIGPLLKESAMRLCQRDVPMVIPGMTFIQPVAHRATNAFRAITFGRMGGEDDPIKQGSLAVAGYGRYVKQAEETGVERQHLFTMYGLAPAEYANEEKLLKQLMRKEADRLVTVNATVFTDDRKTLLDSLADNEVALMLSWHEGFGLVGWEAISAEVPLVVSKRTGLYKLLDSRHDPVGAACVSVVDVRGFDRGGPDDADVTAVAKALHKLAANWLEYHEKAKTLRRHLAEKYTWEGCARAALEACAFSLVATDP
jgi:glycosyltransferase involved in cell wall biosynthesis